MVNPQIWMFVRFVKEPVTVTSSYKAFGNTHGLLSFFNRDSLLSRGSHSMAYDCLGRWVLQYEP